MGRNRLVFATVGILSFVVILIELLQTRILSFIFWNHIVYLATSIALLGFGISGTIIATNKFASWNTERLISILFSTLGLTVVLGYMGTVLLPLVSVFFSPIKIAFCYILFLFPFICAGAIISVIFAQAKSKVGQLYAFDLICAGLGCICFFYLLPLLGAERLLALVVVTSGVLSFLWADKDKRKERLFAVAIVEIGLALALLPVGKWLPLMPEEYKEYRQEMSTPGASVEKTVWTPLCRIDVIGNATLNQLGTQGTIPASQYKILTQDATAHTRILSGKAIHEIMKNTKEGVLEDGTALVYTIKPKPKVAIIGLGGGDDVVRALAADAKVIYGAELNPTTYKFLVHDYGDYREHLFDSPNVRLFNEEGRSMMRGLPEKVDILQINGIDTFAAASSGAYMLSENYLYTVEAMRNFYDGLMPDGILAESRWTGTETLRLVSLACEALKSCDHHEFGKQIFVLVSDAGWTDLIVKKVPFAPEEVRKIMSAASALKLHILYLPKVFPVEEYDGITKRFEPTTSNEIASQQKDYSGLISAFDQGNEKKFFQSYPLLIAPTYDDSPFFFEYGSRNALGLPQFDKLRGVAMSALLTAIAQASFCTLIAIFLPLWKFSRDGIAVPGAVQLSIFFAAVGFAFMLVEVSLMQKCVLFLGNPLYSLSVVLATLLLSAGIGSAIVTRLDWPLKKVVCVFGCALVIVDATLIFFLNSFMYSLITLPLALRMLCTFGMLFPMGLIMGTFFPSGLQFVKERSERYLPWAWGINGCASVYGSFAAILLAIYYGFSVTLTLGAVIYVIGFIAAAGAATKFQRTTD